MCFMRPSPVYRLAQNSVVEKIHSQQITQQADNGNDSVLPPAPEPQKNRYFATVQLDERMPSRG